MRVLLNRAYSGKVVLAALIAVAVLTAVVANGVSGPWAHRPPTELVDDPNPGVPGEFNHGSALLLGSRTLVNQNRRVLADIVAAIDGQLPIVIVVDADDTRRGVLDYLQRRSVRTDHLTFVEVPIKNVWLRDFGPVFVHGFDGRLMVVDPIYNGPESVDDSIPRYLAGYFRLPVVDLPLKLEGGNLLSNGNGLSMFTGSFIAQNIANDLTVEQIREALDRAIPADRYIFLQPLHGEPTQHVDMFATFVATDQVVIASISPDVDPENADLLDRQAATLAQYTTGNRPLRVARIPMGRHDDGIWRSYNNVIFANGVLLVPQYGVEPEVDARAIAVYQDLLPDWRIVGIDASGLIGKAGSLHCISLNVPAGVPIRAGM